MRHPWSPPIGRNQSLVFDHIKPTAQIIFLMQRPCHRGGALPSYVGSVCYVWDGTEEQEATSAPPRCRAAPSIPSGRRLCSCTAKTALCGKSCMEELVSCVSAPSVQGGNGQGGIGGGYAGVTETFVPCLDDPNHQKVTCDGVHIEPDADCSGDRRVYGCVDYAPGGDLSGMCTADGVAGCGVCPASCGSCVNCFRNGGVYYYGGVEQPHPDKYGDGYVTQSRMERCGKGFAFCTKHGMAACKSEGMCDEPVRYPALSPPCHLSQSRDPDAMPPNFGPKLPHPIFTAQSLLQLPTF